MVIREFPRDLMGEARRHVRVKGNTRLLWHIKESGLVGHGRIRNLSASGMLVELASVNALPDQSIFSFDSNLNDANYIPETGQLVWRKKKRFSGNGYLCGFQFVDLPDVLLSRLNKKVEEGIKNLVRMWKINRVVSVFLGVATGVLIMCAVWLGGVIFQDVSKSNRELLAIAHQQSDLTREYQRLYADSTRRLADVTLEFNQTTVLYQQSQNSLQAAQQELAVVKSVLSETEALLAQAQTKNIQQPGVLAGGGKTSQTPDTVRSIQEGKALIVSYRDRIQAVGAQIDQIKYENHIARISALAERDRIRLMYGNQGYLLKNGQAVQVDARQYQSAGFDALPPVQAFHPDSKIRVNVTVFQ